MRVAVIGMGYVGLPLALLCSNKGHDVVGIDVNKEKVAKINNGESPIDDDYIKNNLKKGSVKATTEFSEVKTSDVVVICVPTPVNKEHIPDLSYVESAIRSVTNFLQNKQLVILESTVYPGTTEDFVKPILEKAQKKFFLAHCPERIDPGNKQWTIENIPRVVGGIDQKSTEKAAEFYSTIIDAEIIQVKSSKEAEATKIMENTFRDVNIAFVNEMAKSFQKAGIDITEVIKGASSKPFGFMPHYPGAGVGGHCIAVDPYYLIDNAKKYDFNHEFLKLARKINDSMPAYTVDLLEEEVGTLQGQKVGVLGLAYKSGVDDTRESPAIEIINILKKKGAEVFVYDTFVLGESDASSLEELLNKVDHVVLVTDHEEFKKMEARLLKENNIKVFVDGRNCLDKEKINELGVKYKGIGR